MRVLWSVGILTVSLALLPAPVPAQSLGEAAVREKERREKEGKKPPAKSFTDNDLGTRAGSGTVSQPGSPGESTAPSSGEASPALGQEGETKEEGGAGARPAKTEEEIRAEREKAWQARRQAAQEQINKLTDSIKMLETRLDDPMVSFNSHPRIRAQLETAKQSRLEALEALDKLDAEGREMGFRPQ